MKRLTVIVVVLVALAVPVGVWAGPVRHPEGLEPAMQAPVQGQVKRLSFKRAFEAARRHTQARRQNIGCRRRSLRRFACTERFIVEVWERGAWHPIGHLICRSQVVQRERLVFIPGRCQGVTFEFSS